MAATSSRDKGCSRSTPETSPTKTGWIWRMDTAIEAKLLKCLKVRLYACKTGRNDTLMSQICHVGPRRRRTDPQVVIAERRNATQSREDFASQPKEHDDNAPGFLAV